MKSGTIKYPIWSWPCHWPRDRGLPHHVPVGGATTGLQESTWALCEQARAISTDRLRKPSGTCDEETVAAIRKILRRFLAL